MKIAPAVFLVCFCMVSCLVNDAGSDPSLQDRFLIPSEDAKPWVFWHWMDGNVTREGITADLEAMERVGIGGALMMGVGLQTPPGEADFNSPHWRELYHYAAGECVRLGLKLCLHQCDGWATAGGPWIEPSQSIKMMVWTRKVVTGPSSGKIQLEKPSVREDFYEEVGVVAIPFLDDRVEDPREVLVNGVRSETLSDGDAGTGEDHIREILLKYEAPQVLSALEFTFKEVMKKEYIPTIVEFSEDGKVFKKVKALDIHILDAENIGNTLTFSFPSIKAKVLRIRMQSAMKRPINELTLFSGPRVDLWETKTCSARTREHGGETFMIDSSMQFPARGIPPAEVIDLSSQLSGKGELTWNVPPGKWQIIRVGMTSTGKHVAPRTNAGVGLEADKMSGQAMEYHFDAFAKGMLAENNKEPGMPINSVHTDSWESGIHNWGSGFQQEFEKRCGYSMIPWLPTLTSGVIIGSNDESNRFLWDVRRIMADLIAENFYGTMLEKCHENGVLFQSEAAGRQMFMYDPVNYAAKTDIYVGEFWTGNEVRVDCRLAATAAHIYGRDIAAAEAFTSTNGGGRSYNFNYDMFDIKALGDHAFCTGINRFIIHRYCMQPFKNVEPGLTFGPFGICFERTQTWWENGAKAWCEYISRCQSLLQAGQFSADVIYYIGHDAPNYLGHREDIWNPVPEGYDFDGCNLEILKQLRVEEDGRLVLPSGMIYRVLLLPGREHMTIEAAREVDRLVKAGAVLIGPKPLRTPGLRNWKKNDAELEEIASRVWGAVDGEKITENRYGKGKMIFGPSLDAVLKLMVPPDFSYLTKDDARIRYIHRYTGDADFYFVASENQEEELDAILRFRISGKAPELWDASSGQIIKPDIYRQEGGITELPVHFDRAGSWFVVFREKADADAITEVSKKGKVLFPVSRNESWTGTSIPWFEQEEAASWDVKTASGKSYTVSSTPGEKITLEDPWRLTFPEGKQAPEEIELLTLISWTDHPDPGVRYFSGTASYHSEFTWPEGPDGGEVFLDLGEVKNVAEVNINGMNTGILWKPPFRVGIGEAIQKGRNEIEVKITNLWVNRLVGDEILHPDPGLDYLPYGNWGQDWIAGGPLTSIPDWVRRGGNSPAGRTSFVLWRFYAGDDSELLKSGLLGPVTLTESAEITTNAKGK